MQGLRRTRSTSTAGPGSGRARDVSRADLPDSTGMHGGQSTGGVRPRFQCVRNDNDDDIELMQMPIVSNYEFMADEMLMDTGWTRPK